MADLDLMRQDPMAWCNRTMRIGIIMLLISAVLSIVTIAFLVFLIINFDKDVTLSLGVLIFGVIMSVGSIKPAYDMYRSGYEYRQHLIDLAIDKLAK